MRTAAVCRALALGVLLAGCNSPRNDPNVDADGGAPAGSPTSTCGNQLLEAGETCDPPSSCPSSCPSLGCTRRRLEGRAAACTARCVEDGPQIACVAGDRCCPGGCSEEQDGDCNCACGNGMTEPACGETCDPLSSCPRTCPQQGCRLRQMVNPGTCQAECVDDGVQTACVSGDGCCPSDCNAATDSDCRASCGNGVIETGELCDPPDSCPTSCPAVGCTRRKLEGLAASCTARCLDDGRQTACASGDGCCPAGCTTADDSDCSCACGNGEVESVCGETCDPLSSCAPDCPAVGCRLRRLVNGGSCQAQCVDEGLQSACAAGDDCCPSGCNASNDADCQPRCGNGAVETGEVCDPIASCPLSCPWKGCVRRRLEGRAALCSARCLDDGQQTACHHGDGCCPEACNNSNDNDCAARCGDDVVQGDERCDGDCPTSCPSTGCQTRRLRGSADQCSAECVNDTPISTCTPGDGCCASGCTSANDGDCQCRCGNGATEPACDETCDGDNCPTSCPPMGCRLRTLQGSASACTATCVNAGMQIMCKNGDGCCPAGCHAGNDNNCQPTCGNSTVESGETCDPPSACRTQSDACVDDDNSTRTRMGSAADCTFQCVTEPRACSATSDGFCPSSCAPCQAACSATQDIDCKRPNGATCTTSNQCATACVDGRCCNSTCTATCRACNLAGLLGVCSPVPSGPDNNATRICVLSEACSNGVCKTGNGFSCSVAGDCASGVCNTFFRDEDGDGQGRLTGTKFCGTSPPAGHLATGLDCCDTDARVKRVSMAATWHTTASNCGNFDYDCADGAERELTLQADCLNGATCRGGWNAAVPACGASAAFLNCAPFDPGPGPPMCMREPATTRQQRCH